MPRSTSSNLDMDSIGRSSRSVRGSGSDSYGSRGRSSRGRGGSINDDFGNSLEKAGYNRVNDSRGGWREDDSNKNYTSTTDRMNRHLDLYGKNNGYTNNFNNTFRNSDSSGGNRSSSESGFSGGNRSSSESGFSGRSAISQSIGSHYQSNAAASSAVSGDRRSLTNGLFGRDVTKNAPYSARQDWDNVDFFTSKDRIRDIAHHNIKESLDREGIGNAVGSQIGTMIGYFTEPASMVGAIATGAAQLGATKLGTVADSVLNKESQVLGKMTPGQRAIYNAESQKVRDAYQEDMDSLGSRAAGWGATAAGVVGSLATGGAGGSFFGTVANAFADKYRHNSAMKYAAETLNSPVLKAEIQEDAIKTAQAFRDGEQMRKMAGNTEYTGQGILGTMQQRAKVKNGQYKDEENYSSIPQLVNLWNNISVI